MLWVIGVVIVLIIFAFLKFEHHKKTLHTAILILVIVIIYISMSSMIKSGKMDFSSPRTTISSFVVYGTWLGETGWKLMGIGKDTIKTVGNVILANQTTTK